MKLTVIKCDCCGHIFRMDEAPFVLIKRKCKFIQPKGPEYLFKDLHICWDCFGKIGEMVRKEKEKKE